MRHINLENMIYKIVERQHGQCRYCLFPYSRHVWQQVEDAEGRFSVKLMCPTPFDRFNWEYHDESTQPRSYDP